jgi:hypothetical protein
MKRLLILSGLLVLLGCSEKQEYERIVLEQMKSDKDVKDYHIAPEEMSKCVVETSSSKMSGLMALDPQRKEAYKNYSKMIELNKAEDPAKTLAELRTAFGSPKALAEAHANYAESIVDCMSGLVTSTEKPAEQ